PCRRRAGPRRDRSQRAARASTTRARAAVRPRFDRSPSSAAPTRLVAAGWSRRDRPLCYNPSVSASSAATPLATRRASPLAVGVVVWLASELMFFGGLFAAYYTLRSVDTDW